MSSPVHAVMEFIGKMLLSYFVFLYIHYINWQNTAFYFKFPNIHYIVHIYTLFFSLMFSSLLGYNSTKALEEIRQWW